MSSVASESAPAPTPEPPEGDALIRMLREELIKTQLMVLDLNDRLQARDTDRADAISILGQLELALEAKLTEMRELEQRLNNRIAELQGQLATVEGDRQTLGTRLETVQSQLGSAAREIERLQQLATRQAGELIARTTELGAKSRELEGTQSALAAREQELAAERQRLDLIRRSALWRLGRPWRAVFGPKA